MPVSSVAEANQSARELYDWLGQGVTRPDLDNGWALLRLIEGLTTTREEIAAVVRGRDGEPGWSALWDPDRCPAAWLPWLAQTRGVVLDDDLTEAQKRARIRDRPYARRGTVPYLRAAALTALGSSGVVTIRERQRYPAGADPRRFRVRLYEADLDPNPPTIASLPEGFTLASLPVGLTMPGFTTQGILALAAVNAGKRSDHIAYVETQPGPAGTEVSWVTAADVDPDTTTAADLVGARPGEL